MSQTLRVGSQKKIAIIVAKGGSSYDHMGSQWGGGFHVDRASGELGANLCFYTDITVTKKKAIALISCISA